MSINLFFFHFNPVNNVLKRKTEPVFELIIEFMDIFNEYQSLMGTMPYDDSTLVLLLLTSINLGEDEKIVKTLEGWTKFNQLTEGGIVII